MRNVVSIVCLLPSIGWVACAPPKAIVVADLPNAAAVPPGVAPSPTLPTATPPDDGLRMPDMLTLPGDDEFRRGSTTAPSGSGGGAVIARPPTDPPSRPKPPATNGANGSNGQR